MEVNKHVVEGFEEFEISNAQEDVAPKYASVACLSDAQIAVWTNRVPKHEPWPRELVIDTEFVNAPSDEYLKNVRHKLQLDPDSDAGAKLIGKLEGDVEIERGDFWRR